MATTTNELKNAAGPSTKDSRKLVVDGVAKMNKGESDQGIGMQMIAAGILEGAEAGIRLQMDKDGELPSRPYTTAHLIGMFNFWAETKTSASENTPSFDKDTHREWKNAFVRTFLPEPVVNDPKSPTDNERKKVDQYRADKAKVIRAINFAGAVAFANYTYGDFTPNKGFHVFADDLCAAKVTPIAPKGNVRMYLDNKAIVIAADQRGDEPKTVTIRASAMSLLKAQMPTKSSSNAAGAITLGKAFKLVSSSIKADADLSPDLRKEAMKAYVALGQLFKAMPADIAEQLANNEMTEDGTDGEEKDAA